mmetsp:Transcript_20590/g.48365  ORF Transcript_20590/g.48365 Transcript_20590/m.48365 type:complete len:88 (+) Transcript_20590:743-1006(+)
MYRAQCVIDNMSRLISTQGLACNQRKRSRLHNEKGGSDQQSFRLFRRSAEQHPDRPCPSCLLGCRCDDDAMEEKCRAQVHMQSGRLY